MWARLVLTALLFFTAPAVYAATVVLTWDQNPESDLSGYNLNRCTGAGCTPTAGLTVRPANSVRYDDTTVTEGLTYGYRINAFDTSSNQSAFSATVYRTVPTPPAGGTLVFGATSNSAVGATNTVSWTHAVGSVNNRLITVCAAARGTVQSTVAVSTVTIGGAAATKVRHDERNTGTEFIRTELWYLVAPGTGNQTAVITWAGTPSSWSTGTGMSYGEVDQAAPIDAQGGGTGNGTTVSAVVTTTVADAWLQDCAITKQNAGLVVGAGQTSRSNRIVAGVLDGVGVSTVDGKATPGAETMDWTTTTDNYAISAISLKPASAAAPPAAPRICSLAVDLTGADVGYCGGTTPTQIRINDDFSSTTYAIASFPGGRFTWPAPLNASLTFICAHALDAAAVENVVSDDYRCVPPPSQPVDVAPVVMSNGFPNSTLAAGTTTFQLSFVINKLASCRYHTTDTSYENMPNQMTIQNLTAVFQLVGLTNGSSTTYYGRCDFVDVNNVHHTNPTSIPITVTVAVSSGDVTPPSTVTNLTGVQLGQAQVHLSWSAASDNVAVQRYLTYICMGIGCTEFVSSGGSLTTSQDIFGLPQNTTVAFCVTALDTSNNSSVSCSSPFSMVTSLILDVTPPATLTQLRRMDTSATSLTFSWGDGQDNLAIDGHFLEGCVGMGCSNFTTFASGHSAFDGLVLNLPSMSQVTVRGKFVDLSGNSSVDYGPPVVTTTGPVDGTIAGVLFGASFE